MPRFSAFNSTHFTSKPSYEEQIYAEMVKSLGSGKNYSDDWDSLVAARLYANAMAFGRCKYEIERAGEQFRPSRALENLPILERELGVVPEPGSTIAQRRAEVVVASRIARGASRPNVEAVMVELFGSDFISYVTTASADTFVSPSDPTETGVYDRPGTPRIAFRLVGYVAATGTPVTVLMRQVVGDIHSLRIGQRFVLDTGNYSRCEAVEITALEFVDETSRRVTATYTQPHDVGTVAATGRHANQYTSKRINTFVLKTAAAESARTRKRLARAARRLLRGISQWYVVDESGPFKVGEGRLGITTIGLAPGTGVFDRTFDPSFG